MSIEEDKAMVESWLWENRYMALNHAKNNASCFDGLAPERLQKLIDEQKARIAEVRAAMERLEGEK